MQARLHILRLRLRQQKYSGQQCLMMNHQAKIWKRHK
jgi:hypothetical protein